MHLNFLRACYIKWIIKLEHLTNLNISTFGLHGKTLADWAEPWPSFQL
jgi:hypothetical protein